MNIETGLYNPTIIFILIYFEWMVHTHQLGSFCYNVAISDKRSDYVTHCHMSKITGKLVSWVRSQRAVFWKIKIVLIPKKDHYNGFSR